MEKNQNMVKQKNWLNGKIQLNRKWLNGKMVKWRKIG